MIAEQTATPWPAYTFDVERATVADMIDRAARGWPTYGDGDALAVARGDLSRLVTITTEVAR